MGLAGGNLLWIPTGRVVEEHREEALGEGEDLLEETAGLRVSLTNLLEFKVITATTVLDQSSFLQDRERETPTETKRCGSLPSNSQPAGEEALRTQSRLFLTAYPGPLTSGHSRGRATRGQARCWLRPTGPCPR